MAAATACLWWGCCHHASCMRACADCHRLSARLVQRGRASPSPGFMVCEWRGGRCGLGSHRGHPSHTTHNTSTTTVLSPVRHRVRGPPLLVRGTSWEQASSQTTINYTTAGVCGLCSGLCLLMRATRCMPCTLPLQLLLAATCTSDRATNPTHCRRFVAVCAFTFHL